MTHIRKFKFFALQHAYTVQTHRQERAAECVAGRARASGTVQTWPAPASALPKRAHTSRTWTSRPSLRNSLARRRSYSSDNVSKTHHQAEYRVSALRIAYLSPLRLKQAKQALTCSTTTIITACLKFRPGFWQRTRTSLSRPLDQRHEAPRSRSAAWKVLSSMP